MINISIRLKNKTFWLHIIPAVALVIQQVGDIFNINIGVDIFHLSDQLVALVNSVFAVLAISGIVVDPTTEGYSDTKRTLEAIKPHKNATQTKDPE